MLLTIERALLSIDSRFRQMPVWSLGLLLVMLYSILFFVSPFVWPDASEFLRSKFYNTTFLMYVGVGIVAQLIDGALGMAYGVSASSFLMATGVSPAVASASVHVSEVFTTGASALSHVALKNIKKDLFRRMVMPGVLGAALGAYVLTSFNGDIVKPFVSAYLLLMGLLILRKVFYPPPPHVGEVKRVGWLALLGAFLDSVGGGGWGPVVNSTLLGKGGLAPRYIIGTVNTVEFFVTLTSAGVFTLFLGIDNFTVIGGLITGGVIAAPFGAVLIGKMKPKVLMTMVGILIILLSLRTLVKYIPL